MTPPSPRVATPPSVVRGGVGSLRREVDDIFPKITKLAGGTVEPREDLEES